MLPIVQPKIEFGCRGLANGGYRQADGVHKIKTDMAGAKCSDGADGCLNSSDTHVSILF